MTGVRSIRRAANEVVIAGRGAADNVSAVVERLGATSVTVVTTPSVAASPLLDRIVSAIGADKVTTFTQSRAHTPEKTVLDAADAAESADVLVSLGGSSVVDLTKGVALVLAGGRDFDALRASGPFRSLTLPHIAIPTTLSAAEFTAAAGITNTERGVKEIYLGASLAPRTVILDGDFGEYTPQRLWAGTGMKLVADCIEGMLSARATRFTDALLLDALQILLSDLGSHDDADARQRCLEAAHMTLSNLHNVGVGATAALRHQLGGGAGLPHGEGPDRPHRTDHRCARLAGPPQRSRYRYLFAGCGRSARRCGGISTKQRPTCRRCWSARDSRFRLLSDLLDDECQGLVVVVGE
ncbi:MAG: iron-containing alcohol dehydrogenase [Acidimicrobiales bacterium]